MQQPPSKAQRGHGRVAFLALREAFQKLLADGYPLVTIYNHHKQQLGIGYPQFTKYIHRYLRMPATEHQNKKMAANRLQATTTVVANQDSISPPTPLGKQAIFIHNPNSGNIRKDLV